MKRNLFVYLGIVLLTVLAACKSKDKNTPEEKATTDSTVVETNDLAFSRETIDTFNTSGFSTYAKQRSKQFDWSRFRMTTSWTDNTLLSRSWKPDKNYYATYGPLLKYSPDSSMFIDLDSYNLVIKKDKKGRLVATEIGPDTEVSLVNPATGQKTRLLFLGPGGSVEEALWLDKDNLVLMGVQENDSTGKTAAVWKYNVPTQTFLLYELPDSAIARQLMGYWKTERLKGIVQQ